jgi:hypothetical protein
MMGRAGEDGLTLAAARTFQQATDWHERRPVDALPERSCIQPTPAE